MSKILFYPKCAKSFINFCYSDKHLTNKYVTKLINVKPFDVTLRDGLQGLSKEEQNNMKAKDMLNLYYKIKENYNPKNMEIGSIVSSKVLPIFKNCDSFYNYVEYNQLEPDEPKVNHYILIPNENQFENINKFFGLDNFSFITSVSESFQIKNTKMNLDTTFQQINNMIKLLDDTPLRNNKKLYISCINECPIEGNINNNIIIEKILKYQELNINNLCLSDTCGTLKLEDFKYIITNLKKDKNKNYSNISLHLHVKPGSEDEVEKIIHSAIDLGIKSFDVSALESGGCSVTMDKNKLTPNLSYELYYKCLTNYLLK